MTTNFDGYLLRSTKKWQLYLEELVGDGGHICILKNQSYLLYLQENQSLKLREIGYSDKAALNEALAKANQLAWAGGTSNILWDAPMTVPLDIQANEQQIPFAMFCPLNHQTALTYKPENWINEYT